MAAVVGILSVSDARPAEAQVLGVFRWQMQPYCNVVTLTVIQQGSNYQLTGSDDLCGALQVAPATGTATLNPNGTIALAFDAILPTGAAAHVSAIMNLATVSGTWSDADGHTGAFAFNPPTVAGSPRPAPARSVAITSAQLAASIFAGSGAATTIARSDHIHDDRYYTQAQSDALLDSAVEVIATPGLYLPALVNEFFGTSALSETVTSTTAGRWLVSKTARVYLTCPTAVPIFFLLVDGVPLVSSAIPSTGGTFTALTLVGATPTQLPAGAHAVSVGGDCPGETSSGSGYTSYTAATVTVVR
ncbi:MAG: hypothetical protein R2708_08955 [Vicinamibacterales bacterium]